MWLMATSQWEARTVPLSTQILSKTYNSSFVEVIDRPGVG
jgi:hypothetical protein